MIKMRIPFEPSPFHNICGETLWVTPLKNDHYRLENDPIHEDYQFGDIVRAEEVDGMLEVQELVMRLVPVQ